VRPNHFIGFAVDAGTWFDARVPAPPPGIRRFSPADLHVTIAFLGPVQHLDAERAWASMPALGGPSEVSLDAVVPLGNPRRYSALSALLDEGRADLARRIREVRSPLLEVAGRPQDRRPVKPHVTVARPTRRATDTQREQALAWARRLDLRGVRLRLDTVAWFTWSEDRRGRLFRVVQRRALG